MPVEGKDARYPYQRLGHIGLRLAFLNLLGVDDVDRRCRVERTLLYPAGRDHNLIEGLGLRMAVAQQGDQGGGHLGAPSA